MDPRLLTYYNRELQYIRETGQEFAKEFPKIAGRLGISYHTLHRHVNAILEKLDARNRMEAYTISLRDGLVDCPRLCKYRYAGTA